jgi:hypothetical protein
LLAIRVFETLRIVCALLLALLLSPLLLLSLPLLFLWAKAQRRAGRALGYAVLWPGMRRTLRANTEAWISTEAPGECWNQVYASVDRYFELTRGPRGWMMPLFVHVMEWVPLLTLRRPLSYLPLAERRRLIERHYLPGGLLGPLAWSRQIARLGYHSIEQAARSSGYVEFPLRASRTAPRKLRQEEGGRLTRAEEVA